MQSENAAFKDPPPPLIPLDEDSDDSDAEDQAGIVGDVEGEEEPTEADMHATAGVVFVACYLTLYLTSKLKRAASQNSFRPGDTCACSCRSFTVNSIILSSIGV